jgi:hypothetical protein
MRVLVIESTPGAGGDALSALDDAGHEMVTCHESGPAFPCKGLAAGPGCPLDTGTVDAALLVRDAPTAEPTAFESGVRCALRRKVPLAVAGVTDQHPYGDHASVVSAGFDDLVEATEHARTLGLMPLADAARTALRNMLDREGLDSTAAEVSVQRDGSTLAITLLPGVRLEPVLAETASVRALAAVRGLDPQSSIIDVAVESPAISPV